MTLKQLEENERKRTVICPSFLDDDRTRKVVEFVLGQLENFSISPEFKEKWNEFQLYFIDLTENDARYGHFGLFFNS